MSSLIRNRNSGNATAISTRKDILSYLHNTIALSETKRMGHVHSAPICSLSIDHTTQQFLLSTGADMSIQLFNLESTTYKHGCQAVSPTAHISNAHTSLVSNVEWYPLDMGMFISSSFDHKLKVWDTATMTNVCQFDIGSRILTHGMSPVRGEHALIAAANESPYIRLCDLQNGSMVQSILAHSSGGRAVTWSSQEPFVLASGGEDGKVKLWDIRRTDSNIGEFGGLSSPVESLIFTSDGSRIICTSADNVVRMWRTADTQMDNDTLISIELESFNKQTISRLSPNRASLSTLEDKEYLYCPSGDNPIRLVDINEPASSVVELDGHLAPVICTAWRQRQMELYSGGGDNEILVWKPISMDKLQPKQRNLQQDTWSGSE